jgi:hypothetical protein
MFGRCERIRTFDPLHPMQVRYQAAPHTEVLDYSLRSLCELSAHSQQFSNLKQLAAQLQQRHMDTVGLDIGHAVLKVVRRI